MYFEKSRSHITRHGWTFVHSGEELAPLALQLHDLHKDLEMHARDRAASLLKDPTIHHEDRKVVQAKDDIVTHGKLREQCAVWHYEFERTPSREFSLGANDISFFGIVSVKEACYAGAAKRTEWKFTYKGSDLLQPLAQKLQAMKDEHSGIVQLAKRTVKNAFGETEAEDEYRQEIAENTILMEEFRSNPDKEVQLALGDVVYLNLAPLLKLESQG